MVIHIVLTGVAVCDIIVAGLDSVAEPGDIVYVVGSSSIDVGGHPCNISIDLAKMGYRAGDIIAVSAVGDDLCGNFILNTLRSYGVLAEFQIYSGVQSNKNVILVTRNEDRRFHVDVGATIRLSVDHIARVIERYRPRIFYIAPGLLGSVDEKLRDVLKLSRAYGAVSMVDVGAAKPFSKKDWSFLIDSLDVVDVFHANLYEIRKIFGVGDAGRAAKTILDKGAKIVLITDGGNGAYLAKNDYIIYQPAFRVEVVDPTGAGDAFQAGFIYKLVDVLNGDLDTHHLDDLGLEELRGVLLWAQASGASCVMGVGATTSVSRKNIEWLISSQGSSILRATEVYTIK